MEPRRSFHRKTSILDGCRDPTRHPHPLPPKPSSSTKLTCQRHKNAHFRLTLMENFMHNMVKFLRVMWLLRQNSFLGGEAQKYDK